MNCLEAIDVMGEAVEGRLDPALRTGFEEHMVECRACGTYFEHLQFTRRALKLLPKRGPNPRREELIERFIREHGPRKH